jgi:hypothetical protein
MAKSTEAFHNIAAERPRFHSGEFYSFPVMEVR